MRCSYNPWPRPLKLLRRNSTLVFENQAVRVIKVSYWPHEKLPVHDHAKTPTIYVYLSDSGPVRFSHAEDHPFSLIRRTLRAGAFRISPGRMEVHAVENLSDTPTEFLRVELKTVPLGNHALAFRGNKPFDLTKTRVSVEFDSNVLCVERIIVVKGSPRQHYAATAASLLVAFTPAVVLEPRLPRGTENLLTGAVFWTSQSFDVQPEAAPVHLLRITPK